MRRICDYKRRQAFRHRDELYVVRYHSKASDQVEAVRQSDGTTHTFDGEVKVEPPKGFVF